MRNLFLILIFTVCLFPEASFAGPVVYSVKEVIGFDDSKLSEKSPAFAKFIESVGRPTLAQGFAEAFQKSFGQSAIADIDTSNKHRTLVASLQLVRASHYTVPKMGAVEHHLPVTLSIVFTNPMTTEVVYAFTKTSYATVKLGPGETFESSPQVFLTAVKENYDSLLAGLISEASANYNPVQTDVQITKIWNGLLILNQGLISGIARGDELTDATGAIIKVRFAAEKYAVAEPVLVGEVKEGQVFGKFANQSLGNQVRKPKVLSFSNGFDDDSIKTISNLFESELSKESAFTLLPVHPSMQAVLAAVGRDTNAGQYQITNNRDLPDYFIRFNYAAPRVNEFRVAGKAISYLTYEQYILGELLDRQGRVVFSALGHDEIKDENVGGMVFSVDARREILLKNSVLDLADKFSKSIKFAKLTANVTTVEQGEISIEDPSQQIRTGQTVIVYRQIGKISGIEDEVVVPLWELNVKSANKSILVAETVLPIAQQEGQGLNVEKNDFVIVEAMTAGTPATDGINVSYCTSGESKLGDIDFDDFSVISSGYGYLLPYPLYVSSPSFFEKAKLSVKNGGFRDGLKFGQVDSSDRCINPVHLVKLAKKESQLGYCDAEVSLAVGYRLFKGQDKKSGAAQTTIKLDNVCEVSFYSYLQSEMSRNALGILMDKIQQLRY